MSIVEEILAKARKLPPDEQRQLASALCLGLADVVTHDESLGRITAITTWEPTDI
ncbi:MAG: hypothetical protein QOD00_1335 [Blastocatellia bacterium]|jgi:hypothetical protein|nr:hypothetical protein [Blastocatellia bacterium]